MCMEFNFQEIFFKLLIVLNVASVAVHCLDLTFDQSAHNGSCVILECVDGGIPSPCCSPDNSRSNRHTALMRLSRRVMRGVKLNRLRRKVIVSGDGCSALPSTIWSLMSLEIRSSVHWISTLKLVSASFKKLLRKGRLHPILNVDVTYLPWVHMLLSLQWV